MARAPTGAPHRAGKRSILSRLFERWFLRIGGSRDPKNEYTNSLVRFFIAACAIF